MTDCKYPKPGRCICEELENEDDWKVASPDHNNCFWTYMIDNPRIHTLQEIADLLGMTISAVTTIEKRGLKKLNRRLKSKL
jgi:hypothetical protein